MDVRDVRTKRIDEFYELLQGKKLAWNTVDVMMAALNTFFRRLEYLEVITKTPKFPKVEVPETPKGWINRQKQLQILAAVPEHHKLIVELLIDTAMRPGEVCGLKKRDLVDEGEIVIERSINLRGKIVAPKTKRVRYCAVTSPDLWARLLDHSRLMFPEDFLFSTKLGARYTTHRLHKIWKKACEAVGFYIPLYRGTRHSRASQKRLELEKENVRILREALGHENTGMYQRYARDRKEEI
jgi:integrase